MTHTQTSSSLSSTPNFNLDNDSCTENNSGTHFESSTYTAISQLSEKLGIYRIQDVQTTFSVKKMKKINS